MVLRWYNSRSNQCRRHTTYMGPSNSRLGAHFSTFGAQICELGSQWPIMTFGVMSQLIVDHTGAIMIH